MNFLKFPHTLLYKLSERKKWTKLLLKKRETQNSSEDFEVFLENRSTECHSFSLKQNPRTSSKTWNKEQVGPRLGKDKCDITLWHGQDRINSLPGTHFICVPQCLLGLKIIRRVKCAVVWTSNTQWSHSDGRWQDEKGRLNDLCKFFTLILCLSSQSVAVVSENHVLLLDEDIGPVTTWLWKHRASFRSTERRNGNGRTSIINSKELSLPRAVRLKSRNNKDSRRKW